MQRKSSDEIINRLGIIIYKVDVAGKERVHAEFKQMENKELFGTQAQQIEQYKKMIFGDIVCVIMAAYCEAEPLINSGAISYENWVQRTKDFLVSLRDQGINDIAIPGSALKPEDFKFQSQIEVVVYEDKTTRKAYTYNIVPGEPEGHQRTRTDIELNVDTILIGLSGLFKRVHDDKFRSHDDCLSNLESFLFDYRNNQINSGSSLIHTAPSIEGGDKKSIIIP
jgi:hypothetical protein